MTDSNSFHWSQRENTFPSLKMTPYLGACGCNKPTGILVISKLEYRLASEIGIIQSGGRVRKENILHLSITFGQLKD